MTKRRIVATLQSLLLAVGMAVVTAVLLAMTP